MDVLHQTVILGKSWPGSLEEGHPHSQLGHASPEIHLLFS